MPKPAHKSGERGPYAGGVARREAILDATVDMIAEVGYHGLSMRDVARRVGISPSRGYLSLPLQRSPTHGGY